MKQYFSFQNEVILLLFCVPDVGEVLHEVIEGWTGQQRLQDCVHKAPVRSEQKQNIYKI